MGFIAVNIVLTICLTQFLMSSAFAECSLQRVVHTIQYRDCHQKRLLSFACNGTCNSYTKVSRTNPSELERSCQCCQEIRVVQRRTAIRCPGDEPGIPFKRVIVPVVYPVSCMCRACSQTPEVVASSDYDINKKWTGTGFEPKYAQTLKSVVNTVNDTKLAWLARNLSFPVINKPTVSKETHNST